MSLNINYIDAPEGAQDNAVASGVHGNSLSDPALLTSGAADIPYATLEPGIWKLDGSMRILPDDPNPGWWSAERSGADGRFLKNPVITVSFPTPYASTGFTFTFSPATDQWCSEIHARWYSGQFLIIDKTYYPTSPVWELVEAVESFDRIEIELLRTNRSEQFAKIQRVEIGRTVLLGAKELTMVRLVNDLDPTLCTLPVDTMAFEMHDTQGRSFMPQENQRIELLHNGKLRAVHYIKTSTRKSEKDYSIRCQSSIGLLNDEFLGGLYLEKPVKELLTEILGSWEYDLAPIFEDKTVTGYIPVCTQREALQQVAFAIGAMVTTQDSSKIRLMSVPSSVSAKFTDNDIIIGGSVRTASRYARVEVYSHSYIKSNDIEKILNEEEVDGTDVLFTFSYPHYDYEITGGEITAYGDNWVMITASGLVTLSAKTYTHNTRAYIKRNPEATAKERGNYISIPEATLIHSGNAQEAVDRLYLAVQRRQTVSQQVVVSSQKVGQIVSSKTPWDTVSQGFISSMDSMITQTGHVADIQIQGIEVKMESVWFYSGEVYSGGQEVLY
jgi:hypothetical protein